MSTDPGSSSIQPVTSVTTSSSVTEWSHTDWSYTNTQWSHTDWTHSWWTHSQWSNPNWCYQNQYYCYPSYPNYPGYPGYPSYPGYPGYPGQPGYPGYPGQPGYTYQTTTTVTTYVTSGVSSATTISLTPVAGTSVHDVWMTITPLQGGEFSVTLSAQGLQAGGIYLLEGITGGAQVGTAPFASTIAASEFSADGQGNGMYSYIAVTNPQTQFTGASLLYLPNNQITNSVLVATGPIG